MKLNNLLEQLDKKEIVKVSETTVLKGNFQGQKRIILVGKNNKVVLSESAYNFYKYQHLIGKEILVELEPTSLTKATVIEGKLEQVRISYMEEII